MENGEKPGFQLDTQAGAASLVSYVRKVVSYLYYSQGIINQKLLPINLLL